MRKIDPESLEPQVPDMPKPHFVEKVFHTIPLKVVSRKVGKFMNSKKSKFLIKPFAKIYKVDLDEAEKPLEEFTTMNEFFTRKLQPKYRPIDADLSSIVSPCDGYVSQMGPILHHGAIVQAKGRSYTIAELLGGDEKTAKHFRNGMFMTLYLSPSEYHRYHMPLGGNIVGFTYVPGKLFPVNRLGVNYVDGLFAKNERLITYVQTNAGNMAVAKVGATMVGSMKVNYADLTSHVSKSIPLSQSLSTKPFMAKGDELGQFEMGSTIILLFEQGKVDFLSSVRPGDFVCMGERIGTVRRNFLKS